MLNRLVDGVGAWRHRFGQYLCMTPALRVRALAWPLCAVFLLTLPECLYAERVFNIASLNVADPYIVAFQGFKARMTELGYRDSQTVRYQYYNARSDEKLLRSFAQKMVQEKVDLIVTTSTVATLASAKAAEGSGIPVVFLSSGNPQALVNSFAGSGRNLAGISSGSVELTGKRFELLRTLFPKAKRVAMPLDPKGVNYKPIVSETAASAERLGFKIWEIGVANTEEIERASSFITRKSADAVFIAPDFRVTGEGAEFLIRQSLKEKLPLITSLLPNVRQGCLATYAADLFALGQQGAGLADKIFRGAKPGDLPVELPKKFALAFNTATAKAIDLKIPKDLLLLADKIFE